MENRIFVFSSLLLASLKLSDNRDYEPQIRARLGIITLSCKLVVLGLASFMKNSLQFPIENRIHDDCSSGCNHWRVRRAIKTGISTNRHCWNNSRFSPRGRGLCMSGIFFENGKPLERIPHHLDHNIRIWTLCKGPTMSMPPPPSVSDRSQCHPSLNIAELTVLSRKIVPSENLKSHLYDGRCEATWKQWTHTPLARGRFTWSSRW